MREELKEAILEGARVVVLSVIPVILMGINQETGGISINWQLVGAVALITALRTLDKYLHLKGKASAKKNDPRVYGLTGF